MAQAFVFMVIVGSLITLGMVTTGIILLAKGITAAANPVKVVEAQNKKRIAEGKEPMSGEEFDIAVSKAREKGICRAVVGGVIVLFIAILIIRTL